MNKYIYIYNTWAFKEVLLQEDVRLETNIVINEKDFHLYKSLILNCENIEGTWRLYRPKGVNSFKISSEVLEYIDLGGNGSINIKTSYGEEIKLVVGSRKEEFAIFKKYAFENGSNLKVGTDNSFNIHYTNTSLSKSVNESLLKTAFDLIKNGKSATINVHSQGVFLNGIKLEKTAELNFADTIRTFGLTIVYLGDILAVSFLEKGEVKLSELSSSELKALVPSGDKKANIKKEMFHRAPRIIPKLDDEVITIDPPPNPKDTQETPLFNIIGPSITMALPMLLGTGVTVAAANMSSSMGGSLFMMTGMITAVVSASIGTYWARRNFKYAKEKDKQDEEKRRTKYGDYLKKKQLYIDSLFNEYTRIQREKYPSADMVLRYDTSEEKLWNRNFRQKDVLFCRLGMGDEPFPVNIEVQKEKFSMIDDDMADKPKAIKEQYKMMKFVPMGVDLKEKGFVACIGERGAWKSLIKNLIIQLAGSNSYTDLKLVFAYDKNKLSDEKEWNFVKHLPHLWSEDKKIRYFASDKAGAGEIFYQLGQTIRTRSEEEKASRRPYYVIFILDKEILSGELISKYISENSSELGFSTVIAVDSYKEVPNSCEFIIEKNADFSGMYSTKDENIEKINIQFDENSEDSLQEFAIKLANIELGEAESGGEIPNAISFFDMYDIARPEELKAEERWRRSNIVASMKAMIGVKNGGTPCYLDIHERYHGPHGLVAGTTGSGKSETLQTYMLSLAINYSPDDIGFFIIDYKGGGMANLFEKLPHMIGSISNLSGNQVKRAMISIKSENKRRQRMFTECGVNNINAYTTLYKNGDVKEPIPHIFIIIDEFAELKREEPDFMRELISVAQVGRSLGVHLILSTQKPAGTVDDNIWSNSKFRLCLRVQDRQDSMDMLHRPDAAYLTQAGRGFLQVGNDELFELFQSGYSGATYDESIGNAKFVVAQLLNSTAKVDLVGNYTKILHQEKAKKNWINLICLAMEDTLSKLKIQANAISEYSYSEEFLDNVYSHITKVKNDYPRNSYNDSRLRDFAQIFKEYKLSNTTKDKYDFIMELALKNKIKLPEMKVKSQLEAINEYLLSVAKKHGYIRDIHLWLPVLPTFITLNELDGYIDLELKQRLENAENEFSLFVMVGKGDDPENQNQMSIRLDLLNGGHHAICGTVATGKSTFLQTAIYAFINKYSSEEINFYIIDFSSKALTVFENAKQVGGIMTDKEEDIDKIAKFFTMLNTIIADRKKILASSNFRDYVEHGLGKLPAIVIVIDNYAGFREKTDEKFEDIIKRVAKEGISYGIYLVVTAASFANAELPMRLADNFRTTISLEMSDIYQYSDVMRVVRTPVYPESAVAGRGLVHFAGKIIEFQTAIACKGEGSFERNSNIKERIKAINKIDSGIGARKVPVIPENPTWEDYIKEESYKLLLDNPRTIATGYDAENASYSFIELTNLLTYVVSGSKKSGKSTYMRHLMHVFADKKADVNIIEIGSEEFKNTALNISANYIDSAEKIYDFTKDTLHKEAGIRAVTKKECMAKNLENEDFFEAMSGYKNIAVFIPNIRGFLEEIYNRESKAFNALKVLETLVGDKGYHYNFYFFIELNDNEISEVSGYKFIQSFKDNAVGIRFGGRFTSQRFFSYANVQFRLQDNAMNVGIGVKPSEDANSKLEKIVVPNNRG